MAEVIDPNVFSGQRLRFVRDVDVLAVIGWKAPMTSGQRVRVPVGTVVEVTTDSVPSAPGFQCQPLDYEDFGGRFIDYHASNPDKYTGYALVVPKQMIGRDLELIGHVD